MWRIAKLAFQPLTTQPYLWGVLGERLKHLAYQVCFESLCDSIGTCFPDNEHVVLSVCSASRFHVRCRILVQPQMLVSSGSLERPCSLEHWVLSVSLPPSPCLSVSVQNRGDFPQRTSHSACRCDHIRWWCRYSEVKYLTLLCLKIFLRSKRWWVILQWGNLKCLVSPVIKVGINWVVSYWQHVTLTWCGWEGHFTSVILLQNARNLSVIVRKTLGKTKWKDVLQNICLASFKAIKVIKARERLRNRQSLKETKKLWALKSLCDSPVRIPVQRRDI